MVKYDAVVCIGPRHKKLARRAIGSLQTHAQAERIYVITSPDNFGEFESLRNGMPLALLDENTLIEGVTLTSLQDYFVRRGAKPRRAGWYFQQFLKMAFCFQPNTTDHYLIWDSDTILLRRIEFFDGEGGTLVKPAAENHPPYFKLTQKLLGVGRLAPYSFIAEHLMVKKEHMRRLVARIASHCSSPNGWAWKILDSIDDCDLSFSGFSEYETYGTFVEQQYPGTNRPRPIESLRGGAGMYGMNPNRCDLYALSKKYSYVSFEHWSRGPRRVVWRNKIKAAASALLHL